MKKKVLLMIACVAAMLAAGTGLKAQEVTITLMPGWTWISIPSTETMDFATALGSFTPAVGDRIKSQWGNATYRGNGEWRGQISEFYPGYGYMYYSTRQVPVSVTFNAQQPSQQVVVTTDLPVFITAVSAMCGGNVVSNDGTYIIVKGICWATHETPTSNDNYLEFGSGEGSFTTTWNDLEINTTYYVRAYAVTPNGTVYGAQQVFTTKDGIPVLTTMDVTDILRTSATGGGNITDNGGLNITARGVCWSTSPNPTINDIHTTDDSETSDFISSIYGLSPNTIYYVRAYATNSFATSYGEEKTFTTIEQIWNNGISPGTFSVSATQQVNFSQGNLQYQASTNTWRFAEDQFAFVGGTDYWSNESGNVYENGVKCSNNAISPSYSGWIDLFGWGTSGYNHGANCYQPWSTDGAYYEGDCSHFEGDDYYLAYGGSYNLYDQTGQADWGYNAISNGGNQENLWYTLSQPEWDYVFNTRNTNSGIRYAKACVNEVNGVVLLPDDWNASIYTLNDANGGNYGSNMISASDWLNVFEPVGAVFLPAAGGRCPEWIWDGGESSNLHLMYGCGSSGDYWSTTHYYGAFDNYCGEVINNVNYAKLVDFSSNNLNTEGYSNHYCILFTGHSVRLVSPIQPKAFTTVTNITETTATCEGRIVNSGVNAVTECGFCWGTEPNPTIDNNVFIANGGTTGVFTMELTNLVPNMKYYVRAFATNSLGTFYGDEVSFTCRNTPEGAVNGLFSVSSNSQVYFSDGNLQCHIDSDQATETIVGTGTATVAHSPYNTSYKYSLSQMLYRAEELHAVGLEAGQIVSIAFQSNSTNNYNRNISIWMANTAVAEMTATSMTTSNMTRVFGGSVLQETGWTEIHFNNSAFMWDGENNVIVTVFMSRYPSNNDNDTYWLSSQTEFASCGYAQNNSSSFYPESRTYSLNTTSQRPNIRFKVGEVSWRFAEHQWDYVGGTYCNGNVSGGNNSNISPTYLGWIDLFGWGTSGYNHGAVCYQPWSTSQTSSNYYAYGNSTYNLYDQTGQADWGYNPISNGGNIPNAWRTLTQPEWSYIFNTRATTSGIRYAKAQVNDVNGVILLPDDWSPTTYNLNNVNTSSASFSSNTITVSQWTTFENAGAVFLPAAGDRLGADDPENGGCVYNVGSRGFYWSSSRNNNSYARNVLIKDEGLSTNDSNRRCYGFSVRLVRVAE